MKIVIDNYDDQGCGLLWWYTLTPDDSDEPVAQGWGCSASEVLQHVTQELEERGCV